jgi:hypothetical protein
MQYMGRLRFPRPGRGARQLPTHDISVKPRWSRPQSADFSDLSGSPAFRSPRLDGGASLNRLSAAMGDS